MGHAGTLDPFASGLLVVLIGRATRLSQYLVGLRKSYTGRIRLGVETETDDLTGAETGTSEAWREIETDAIEQSMALLTGRIVQHPPVYSAKKSEGERAYRLARRGEAVALDATEVDVEAFTLVSREGSAIDFQAEVGSGTYIRALARDLGAALGCGAHLEELRRTAVGHFRVEDAVGPDALGAHESPIHPAVDAVRHLPVHDLATDECDAVRHGRPISAPRWDENPVALVFEGQLIAIAERQGDVLKPRVVLVDG